MGGQGSQATYESANLLGPTPHVNKTILKNLGGWEEGLDVPIRGASNRTDSQRFTIARFESQSQIPFDSLWCLSLTAVIVL